MSDQVPAGGDTGVSDLAREAAVQVNGPTGDGERPQFHRRQGYITAIASDWLTCSIKFPESTDPIPGVRFMHPGQHPHVGDTVWVDQNGPDTVVSSIDATPVGLIALWHQSTPPKGWLAMNGQSTNGYPKLAAIYGANLPNWDGLFPVGAGGAYAVGSTGGVATNTAVPSHAHTQPAHTHLDPAHDHPPGGHVHSPLGGGEYLTSSGQGTPYGIQNGSYYVFRGQANTSAPSQSGFTGLGAGGQTGSAGGENTGATGNTSVENRPPYRAVLFIVKHD